MIPHPYILLLEDSDDDAALINYALVRGGLNGPVTRVQTREEFMRAICAQPPAAFLSDHGLPAFDGMEALNVARHRCPEVPFLFVSGMMAPDEIQAALRDGAAGFIAKSDLAALVPTICRAMGMSPPSRRALPGTVPPAPIPIPRGGDQRLQLFVDIIEEDFAFYILDETGKIVAWNAATTRLLGHTALDMIGETERRLFPSGETGGLLSASSGAAYAPEHGGGARLRKDGSRCEVEARVSLLQDPAGEVFGHVVVLRGAGAPEKPVPASGHDDNLDDAIRAIPSCRPHPPESGSTAVALRVGILSPANASEAISDERMEAASAAFDTAVTDVMCNPRRAGFYTLACGQLLRLTRALQELDALLSRRELRLTEDAKRLSACRRRLMEDDAAAKKRLHLLTSTFLENKRAYR